MSVKKKAEDAVMRDKILRLRESARKRMKAKLSPEKMAELAGAMLGARDVPPADYAHPTEDDAVPQLVKDALSVVAYRSPVERGIAMGHLSAHMMLRKYGGGRCDD